MFSGKIAVITGASSGIGAMMAKQLALRGATPVLMARSEDKLREAADGLEGKPHAVYVLDVASTEQVMATMEQVIERFGRIDILINSAGYGVFQSFIDADILEIHSMMDVNYMGTVRCTKAVLPHMLRAQSGHIVNVASMAGKIGTAKSSGYAAAKHAVLGFTNSLRQELAGTGVHLTAINPGPIDTPFFDRADPTGNYVKNIRWFMLKPEQVVNKVLWAIERRVPELNLPYTAHLGVKLFQLFPGVFNKLAHKVLNKK
ncbi:SDR family NAD(P)-dependent oxidoreductase [Paenibacillus xerothermodurans]|uniref:SDR family NAD(P)-dependent oxidoreductase n=1 Tax=Paenibacillus xerothermodurans TaxID=1977292 RepID=A0A2W1N9N9_PAEXE|nr:SDR family oxidoreductase [Paenibacillus xerothermodurans]PZE21359.1 SDR family NAD(P)-dependent oxidoreductase [Paenibacillus xerothermodurans]